MKTLIAIVKVLLGWAIFYIYIIIGSWLLFDSNLPLIFALPVFVAIAIPSMTLFDYFAFDDFFDRWVKNSKFAKRVRFNGLETAHKIHTKQPLSPFEKITMAIGLPYSITVALRATMSRKYKDQLNNKIEENEREYQELLKEQ